MRWPFRAPGGAPVVDMVTDQPVVAAVAATHPSRAEAALALGLPEREVVDVGRAHGLVTVTTTDDVTYVIVPADHVDGAGHSGVLVLEAPAAFSDALVSRFTPIPRRT